MKYKARWCVNRLSGMFAWPNEATFSPVAETTTVRFLFAIAVATGNDVLQADFPNADINASIEEEVYVTQPYGFHGEKNRNKVC